MGAVVTNLKPKTGRLDDLSGFGGHAWTVMEFRCCNDADLDPKEPKFDNQCGLRQMDANNHVEPHVLFIAGQRGQEPINKFDGTPVGAVFISTQSNPESRAH